MLLRGAGAVLLVLCGWCAGDAVQAGRRARAEALQWVVWLLQRLRQEIAYRQSDLALLYSQFCREEPRLPSGGSFGTLPPPPGLDAGQQARFTQCLAGLGRQAAAQECERLDYYRQRFAAELAEARRQEQAQAALTHKLGLAAGAVLALWLL